MRQLCLLLLVAFVISACDNRLPTLVEETDEFKQSADAPFYHGVASGDPLQDAVIIWTRVTPSVQTSVVEVQWAISAQADMSDPIQVGSSVADSAADYTVKVDVKQLLPGSRYYYQFEALGSKSPVGKTKTSPEEADEVVFAVVSCSNYEFGYFNGYGAIASEEIDAVLHLGDYIYEYGPGVYGDSTVDRKHLPAKELISLRDYRTRYAQYRLDPDLKDAHINHPFIMIWDDHEISNNSYKDGAQNHQADEGDYQTRRDAAVQAYYEWMPVRSSEQLYRTFSYGEQVDLIMLDERLAGRTQPADSLDDPSLQDASRTMLGKEQLDWFLDQLTSSKAKWKVIGNQVIFSYLNWGHETFNINLDSWDGYPGEQAIIADLIRDNQIENVVFVTGDTHSAWGFEATHQPFDDYNPTTGEGAYAIEFGTTSINSGNSNERMSDEEVLAHEVKIANSPLNPHLKYTNMRDHGYLIITLSDKEVLATWKYTETPRERNRSIKSSVSMKSASGSNRLESL
ncbi:MAG: alkaline phosphatase D [Cyclobacteriaceae bacterium]|jgi:alkaline phosphatase D